MVGLYPTGAHRALCETKAMVDPLSPLAKVTAVATMFPDTGLAQPQLLGIVFHTANARMLSVFYLPVAFALSPHASAGVGAIDVLAYPGSPSSQTASHQPLLQ